MRKVILSTNITLDGFMAGPHGELDWHFANWNDEMSDFALTQLREMDCILAGRVTYESMACSFSPLTDEFADMMNSYRKVVFSKTLTDTDWNNSTIVRENLADEVNTLKALPGKDMIMWGGVEIVHSFIDLGLIDEYRLSVNPVVLGEGRPLFKDGNQRQNLKLVQSRTFNTGVVMSYYQPVQ